VSIAREMHQSSQSGAIVTIICDGGLRYTDNYYNTSWLAQSGLNSDESHKRIEKLWFGTTS